MDKIKEENNKLKDNNDKLMEKNKTLVKDIRELKNNKNIQEDDNKKQIDELNKSLLKQNEENEKLKKENDDLQKKLSIEENKLKEYNKLINDKLINTQNELKGLQQKIKTLENDNIQKNNEINRLNGLNEKNKIEENEVIQKLKKEINEEKQNNTNIQNQLKNKEKLLEESNDKAAALQLVFEEYKNKEKEILDKEKKIREKERQIEKENNNIRIEREKLKKDINENNKLKQENRDLIIKNNNLQNQINDKQNIFNRIIQNSMISQESGKLEPLIGLNNIGATCFMNATLQCLSQTKELTIFFLNDKNKNTIINNNIAVANKNELQLSPVFYELIKNLWDIKSPKSISPYNFMNIIEKMNPLFKQGQAGDSKDFIIFILEQLHKELKKSVKNITNTGTNNTNQLPNQYDKNITFAYFFDNFKEQCSIISDIFFGITETTNECVNCKNMYTFQGLNNPICYNYQIFNCIIFPLEEVKKLKNNSFQMNGIQFNNNRVSLEECFFYFQKIDYFTGDNSNFCNLCRQLCDSMYSNKIFIGPNVLVLILNRGKGNIYDVKLDFYENIDITQFVLQKDKPKITYNLYGVITHIGKSGPNAHFVASCKNYITNKWYRFNDAIVSPITDDKKEVIDFGTPYILFYHRNN